MAGQIPQWIYYVLAIGWGGIWGSFATCIIWRFPKRLSIVSPGSRCPACKNPIKWYDNIPVISFFILRGRCRRCRQKISLFYPSVEISCIILAVVAIYMSLNKYHLPPMVLANFFIYFTFFWSLFVITIIDLETMLIPDMITLPGIVIFLFYNFITNPEEVFFTALAVAGAYLSVLIFFNLLYRLISGVEGMGIGDGKLLAMIASLLGWKGLIFSIVLGAFQGLIIHTPALLIKLKVKKKEKENTALLKTAVPFGPMLALSAFEFVLFGDEITRCFLGVADRVVGCFI